MMMEREKKRRTEERQQRNLGEKSRLIAAMIAEKPALPATNNAGDDRVQEPKAPSKEIVVNQYNHGSIDLGNIIAVLDDESEDEDCFIMPKEALLLNKEDYMPTEIAAEQLDNDMDVNAMLLDENDDDEILFADTLSDCLLHRTRECRRWPRRQPQQEPPLIALRPAHGSLHLGMERIDSSPLHFSFLPPLRRTRGMRGQDQAPPPQGNVLRFVHRKRPQQASSTV